MHILKIPQEMIDYRKTLEEEYKKCSGDLAKFWNTVAPKILQQWEELRQYPPRLSLKITRTQRAQEHLKTVVTVNGVEPLQKKKQLDIDLVAPSLGK